MAINGANGAKKPGSVLDHSGYLFNEYSKGPELRMARLKNMSFLLGLGSCRSQEHTATDVIGN
jgi:hypothetical protein